MTIAGLALTMLEVINPANGRSA